MGKIELLAPAGAYQTLKAVTQAGADAVYLGGSAFGARAYANNFTKDELLDAIDYMHLHGKKLYLTVNTLLKEREINEQLYDYLLPYYEQGLDAVIVQDFGVISFLREAFPLLDIHASTQMTITGADGAAFLLDQGVKRIVTSRELSLKEIRKIKDETGAEIESFVHGALCYCYSGQCLLSSMLGGRSGNRGRCAQPCRLAYEVLDSRKKSLSKEPTYLLSPKDLCTIELIPELAQAGIDSFKIEGRMKQTEYAAGVTSVYRKYLDRYEADGAEAFSVSKNDYRILLDLGNRSGFTDGYYKRHNGAEMITFNKPGHEKSKHSANDSVSTTTQENLQEKIKGKLILSKGEYATLTVTYQDLAITVLGETVQEAKSKPLSEADVRQKMNKTGNTPFVFESLEIVMDKDSFIPIGQLNALRRNALEQISEQRLTSYRRKENSSFLQKHEPIVAKSNTSPDVRVSLESLKHLDFICEQEFVTGIYVDATAVLSGQGISGLEDICKKIQQAEKECYLMLPFIFRERTRNAYERLWASLSKIPFDGMLIRNYEELGFLQKHQYGGRIHADSNLYAYSNRAHAAFQNVGITQDTVPLELNSKELLHRDCSGSELLLYGTIPLMVTAGCVAKSLGVCKKENQSFYLKDRYEKEFLIKTDCQNCYNLIYNSTPLALFGMSKEVKALHCGSYRLHFNTENRQQIQKILTLFRRVYLEGEVLQKDAIDFAYTNGHMKRGVE